MCEVARRCGAEVVRVDAPWGRAIDPQRLLDAQRAHPDARLARGRARGDVDRRRERRSRRSPRCSDTDTLLLVDTVTSLGGIPVDVDGWGIDAVLLGHAEVPRRAARSVAGQLLRPARSSGSAAARHPPQSWYLDLGLIADYVGSRAPLPPHRADLDALRAARRARRAARRRARSRRGRATAQVGAPLQDALPELGFRLFARGAPAPAAHVGLAARRRRRRQGPRRAARTASTSRSAAASASSRARAGASASWATAPASTR